MNREERRQLFRAGEAVIAVAIVDALRSESPDSLTTQEVAGALGLLDWGDPERRMYRGLLTRLAKNEREPVEMLPHSHGEIYRWRYKSE